MEGIVNGIFFNQGHVCCAGSRLLVQESIAAEVLAKLKNRIKVLRVGDPLDKNTDIGAINSKEQLATIQRLVASGVKEGATMFQPACKLPAKGYYFRPTVFFSNVTMSHRIAREEIFGPVLSMITFRTVEEAVEKANNTAYGLSAGVWTDKGSRILKMSTELKAGVVWANTFNKFDPTSPFGGYKESGFGREGGRQGPARLLQTCLSGHVWTRKFFTAPIKTDKMPPGIPYIVGNEAAERFNFYGMRAVLFVFMTKYLVDRSGVAKAPMSDNSEANQMVIIGLLPLLIIFSPTLGAVISDAFLGKYRTIIWLSFVYCAGKRGAGARSHADLGSTIGLGPDRDWGGRHQALRVSAHVGDQFSAKTNQHLISPVPSVGFIFPSTRVRPISM